MTDLSLFRSDPRVVRWSLPLSRRRLLAGSGAALAAAGIPGVGAAFQAGEATPVATPAPEMAEFFVEFIHFEKFFALWGVSLAEDQLAALYGLDATTYRDIRARFDANARQAAEELLADAAFAERVDRLPFAPGDTVVGVADSITDDLQSWLEILRHLLELRRPNDKIQIVNQGISGDTTTDALGRYIATVAVQPAWIICMLGTNDAFRLGAQPTKTRVSLDETALNLAALRHIAATETAANWAWITSPPCDEALAAASPYAAQFHMSNDDLVAIAEVVRRQPEPVVDLFAVLGVPPARELINEDGIHPTLAGQQAIARAVVERLTE